MKVYKDQFVRYRYIDDLDILAAIHSPFPAGMFGHCYRHLASLSSALCNGRRQLGGSRLKMCRLCGQYSVLGGLLLSLLCYRFILFVAERRL